MTPFEPREGFDRIAAAMAEVVSFSRSLPAGLAPVASIYLDGAVGNLIHARDELRAALIGDRAGWRADIAGIGLVQAGVAGEMTSATVTGGEAEGEPGPDLGADAIRSGRMMELSRRTGFAALLASALAEHRWVHVRSGVTWASTWPAADALVRALGGGRPFPAIGHVALRGTIDRRVAEELAALGWRRLSSPRLPGH